MLEQLRDPSALEGMARFGSTTMTPGEASLYL